MTPSSLRIRSWTPQKQPPARIAFSASAISQIPPRDRCSLALHVETNGASAVPSVPGPAPEAASISVRRPDAPMSFAGGGAGPRRGRGQSGLEQLVQRDRKLANAATGRVVDRVGY